MGPHHTESGAKTPLVGRLVTDCTRFARNLAKKAMKYASERRPFFPTFWLPREKVPPIVFLRDSTFAIVLVANAGDSQTLLME